jgi:glycosyltransferase EpsJ
MPAISVIVPVYRAETTLARCVDSILSQTFRDFELLLIDDGSPDGSGALCDQYAARDSRVRVFHKENDGVSSARNLGLYKAQGTYIAFADSDDWMEPAELETLYNLLAGNNADSSGCAHNNVSPSGAVQPEAGALPPGVYEGEALRSGLVDRLMGHRLEQPGQPVLNGYIWRFLFSRDIISRYHILFDGAYLEDELFLVEYFSRARRLAMTDQPLYNYLINPNSAVHRYMAHYPDTFRSFLARKRTLAQTLDIASRVPDWEDSTLWAGLLIAVSNVYAPGNPFSSAQQTGQVRAIAESADFSTVISRVRPVGLSRNKALVAALLRGKHYRLLTMLYRIKNRRR